MNAPTPTGAPASASDAVVIPRRIEVAINSLGSRLYAEGYEDGRAGKHSDDDTAISASLRRDLFREIAAALSPPPAVPESMRRLSEAIQVTDACVPGVYQYPVHGDAEWLVGWLFTKPNLDAGKRKVADLARLALEVRNLLAEPGDDEPLTSTDAVRAWEAEQAMAAGEPTTSADALALWKVEQGTPSGRADTPPAGGGAVDGGVRDALVIALNAFRDVRSQDTEEGRPWHEDAEGSKIIRHCEAALAAAPAAPEPAAGGGREILRRMAAASRSLAEFPPDGLVKGDLYVAVKNEGQGTGWRYRTVGLTVGDLDEARSILSAPSEAETAGGETLQTIAQWCEDTFGPITPERIATRANEEMVELLAEPSKVEEAADVMIVLSRYPGLWGAIERKMKVNRARRWRFMGDGTGYHVKDEPTPATAGAEGGPHADA